MRTGVTPPPAANHLRLDLVERFCEAVAFRVLQRRGAGGGDRIHAARTGMRPSSTGTISSPRSARSCRTALPGLAVAPDEPRAFGDFGAKSGDSFAAAMTRLSQASIASCSSASARRAGASAASRAATGAGSPTSSRTAPPCRSRLAIQSRLSEYATIARANRGGRTWHSSSIPGLEISIMTYGWSSAAMSRWIRWKRSGEIFGCATRITSSNDMRTASCRAVSARSFGSVTGRADRDRAPHKRHPDTPSDASRLRWRTRRRLRERGRLASSASSGGLAARLPGAAARGALLARRGKSGPEAAQVRLDRFSLGLIAASNGRDREGAGPTRDRAEHHGVEIAPPAWRPSPVEQDARCAFCSAAFSSRSLHSCRRPSASSRPSDRRGDRRDHHRPLGGDETVRDRAAGLEQFARHHQVDVADAGASASTGRLPPSSATASGKSRCNTSSRRCAARRRGSRSTARAGPRPWPPTRSSR